MAGRARRATRPTPCHFGATLGLRADCGRSRANLGLRARDGLALRLSGESLGECPGVGREIPRGMTDPGERKQDTAESKADARDPTTSLAPGSDVSQRPSVLSGAAPKKPLDRGRSSETDSDDFGFDRIEKIPNRDRAVARRASPRRRMHRLRARPGMVAVWAAPAGPGHALPRGDPPRARAPRRARVSAHSGDDRCRMAFTGAMAGAPGPLRLSRALSRARQGNPFWAACGRP